MSSIKIVLVEDHKIVIDGLEALLAEEPDLEILRAVQNGDDALQTADELDVDLVLLDINLPGKSGFTVCKELKAKHPNLKIIALTMHGESGYISKMVKAGVDGYVLKNTTRGELVNAIRQVMAGQQFFSQEVTQRLISGMQKPKKSSSGEFIQKLTPREKEILQLIVHEHTTEEIAEKLFISTTTVISHRSSILRKLGVKNTAGIVRVAFEFGLLED